MGKLRDFITTILACLHKTPIPDETPGRAAPPIVIRTEAPPITISTEEPTESVEPSEPESAPAPIASPKEASQASSKVSDLLAEIPVKGRARKTGYERSMFGSGWSDTDRNVCDTRNDILARDLDVHEFKPGTHNSVVLTRTLLDPYTGKAFEFLRGQGTSAAVQIDHIVALSDVWQKGVQQLSAQERIELANDPLNLLAVDGPTNASKGDGDTATWLPPNRGFWCEYVTRQIAVKHKCSLWMTKTEHPASIRVLTNDRT
ncbi:HNH endonuclease family protein [Arthrobacter sp. JUb115]|uniref:HNH endonuclease family protein n=1 Tax=Arthrobacter sp. JUb115 TaxID=2485108 RepID=UPI00105DAB8C